MGDVEALVLHIEKWCCMVKTSEEEKEDLNVDLEIRDFGGLNFLS